MQGILTWLEGLASLIGSLVGFLFGFIEDLLYVITLLGSLIIKIPFMFGWLPTACITLVVTVFGVVLIYKIIGREG